jgi:hypothetical protein
MWRAAAMPVGIALMALFAILRLLREASGATSLAAVVLVAALRGVLARRAGLKTARQLNLLIFFVGVPLLRAGGRADRVRLRPRHLRLSGAGTARR